VRVDRDERTIRWHREWRQLLRDAAQSRYWAKNTRGEKRVAHLTEAESLEARADRLAVFVEPAFVGRRDVYSGPLGGF